MPIITGAELKGKVLPSHLYYLKEALSLLFFGAVAAWLIGIKAALIVYLVPWTFWVMFEALKQRRVRSLLTNSISRKEFAARLGTTEDSIDMAINAGGVKPTAIVNGKPWYAQDALKEAQLLLRPSQAPEEGHLLRPATNSSTDHEQLLRPTNE